MTTVLADGRTVVLCAVTLTLGGGSCRLPSKKLPRGTYDIVARYEGSSTFKPSTSGPRTLTVSR